MISSKGEGIVKMEPTYSGFISRDSIKNTDADLQSGMKQMDTSQSTTKAQGLVNVDKWMELTRVATELHTAEVRDPVLDPTSPEFDVCKWANMVLRAASKAGVKFRRASFTFKNLIVSGSRSTSHFQTNVASIFMAPFRLHEYFSFGNKPRTTILKSFAGVTKSGELLLVLGRPGSGCSTFLKTIAGELHGLMIDKNSVIHYNGIASQKNLCRDLLLTGDQAYPKRR